MISPQCGLCGSLLLRVPLRPLKSRYLNGIGAYVTLSGFCRRPFVANPDPRRVPTHDGDPFRGPCDDFEKAVWSGSLPFDIPPRKR